MAVRVNSTIKLNEAKLNELTKQQYISLAQTADALLTDLRDEQLMPFNTGNLQNDSTFVDDSQREQGRVSIVSSTPYARRLYFHPEYKFNRKINKRARGMWLKMFFRGNKQPQKYADILKRKV